MCKHQQTKFLSFHFEEGPKKKPSSSRVNVERSKREGKKKRLKSWWICWLRTLRPGMDSTRRMRISVASQLILMIHHKSAASSKSKLSAPSKGPVCKTGSREREQTRAKQQKKRKFRSSASVAWNTLHETIGRRKKPSRAAVKKKPNCKRFLCLWHGRSTAPTREEKKKRKPSLAHHRSTAARLHLAKEENNPKEKTWRQNRTTQPKELEESQENERMGCCDVQSRRSTRRPRSSRDHMKLKYHIVGSFLNEPSQGLDVEIRWSLIDGSSLFCLLLLDN